MERLGFGKEVEYNETEAAIHLNRYLFAKEVCENRKVLDCACGEGYGSYLLKKWGAETVDSVDISEETITKARAMFGIKGINFATADVTKLPYEDNSFDLIISLETMEHVENVEGFFKELKRVLTPDGIMIISCPNDPYYYQGGAEKNPYHVREYTFFDFKELAENILGDHVRYYLGFGLNGYINVPFENYFDPKKTSGNSSFEIFHYTEMGNAVQIKNGDFLTHWNSNYYIGVWGKTGTSISESAVCFPREPFVLPADNAIVHNHADTLQEQVNMLKEENSATRMQLERYKQLAQIREEERNMARNTMNENWNYYQEFRGKYEHILSTKGYRILQKLYRVKDIFKK